MATGDNEVVGVEITNYDQWLNAYMAAPKLAITPMRRAMAKATLLIVGYLRVSGYPPDVPGNSPGRVHTIERKDGTTREVPMGYYERGRGAWYPAMRPETLVGISKDQKLGKTRGRVKASVALRKAGIVYGYKLAKGKSGTAGTSERLGQSWTTDVAVTDNGVEGVVGTNTSYADWVQGDDQNQLHAENGWVTLQGAIELSREGIADAFNEAAQEVIDAITKMTGG